MITSEMVIPSVLIFVNIGMGLLLAILEFRCWRTSCDPVRWIRLFYAVIGLYWAGLYSVLVLSSADPGTMQIFVRPGITVTLAAMASWAIIQAKRT
jgi:hypothetical protein